MFAARLLLLALFGLLAWGLIEPGRWTLGTLASSASSLAVGVEQAIRGQVAAASERKPGSPADSCADAPLHAAGGSHAALRASRTVMTFGCELHELAEPQPEPMNEGRHGAERNRDHAGGSGCSCRSAGRRAQNSGALLALLALAAARARDGAAWHGAIA